MLSTCSPPPTSRMHVRHPTRVRPQRAQPITAPPARNATAPTTAGAPAAIRYVKVPAASGTLWKGAGKLGKGGDRPEFGPDRLPRARSFTKVGATGLIVARWRSPAPLRRATTDATARASTWWKCSAIGTPTPTTQPKSASSAGAAPSTGNARAQPEAWARARARGSWPPRTGRRLRGPRC